MSRPSVALGAGHFSKCAKGRLEQESPPGMTLTVAPASPWRSPPPPPGASRARARRARIPGGQVHRGPLTPVMTAASPAGGLGSSGGRSSRSSSGAQRGLLMAPSGLGGGWGAVGGARAGARSSGRAGVSREPAGSYKDEPRRDSRRRPGRRTRGVHGAGTRPAPTRPGPRPPRARAAASPRAPAPGATQAAPAAAFRTRPHGFCGRGHPPLLSWFPQFHVLSAANLQLICSPDV